MINRDRRCVFVADSLGLAEVVAIWLSEQGIPAQVMDVNTLGGLDGLTWLSSTAISARGIEVWALDPDQIDRAKLLLEERKAALEAETSQRTLPASPIAVTCEECDQDTTFPFSERGTVQNCRHCGAYVDVPDDSGDTNPSDYGEEPPEDE